MATGIKSKNFNTQFLGGLTQSQLGVLLVTISALVWSTVGLFAKGIDASVWVILFWRGIFSSVAMCIYISRKSDVGLLAETRNLGWPGWAATIIGGAATICFISAFKYTSIANVSMIYAAVPFIAAALAWLLMRERASRATLLAAVLALTGVGIMVSGSSGTAGLFGDVLAMFMAVGMAALVVIFRKYPDRPMVMSVVYSALMHILISSFLVSPFDVSMTDLLWLVCFGIVFAAATIFMIEGAKRLPASRSALISTMEAPLGPLWAWLIFASVPGVHTWIGAMLIMTAVAGNIYMESRKQDIDSGCHTRR